MPAHKTRALPLNIGIIGPRGLVGEELLALLEKKKWATGLTLISTEPKASGKVQFRKSQLPVHGYTQFLNKRSPLGLLISLAETAWSNRNLKKFYGISPLIIDESNAFRLNPDVPLIVPEINGSTIETNPPKLVASPNCTTVVLVMALAPLLRHGPIRRVIVASYQAASGAGRLARDGFLEETKALASGKTKNSGHFPHSLAGNVFPHIGSFSESGFSQEEEKVMAETKKILGLADLAVSATCVRVPVIRGHSMAIWVEMEKPIPAKPLADFYNGFPGVVLQEPYPTPLYAAGQPGVRVGRLRHDPVWPNGLSLWACGDNLLKGAAQNVVQIAELLLNSSHG